MSHEGYADPITNDGPGFHSNVPVSELTERVTRAIEASDVSSAPPFVRNRGRGNAQNSTDPYQAQQGSGAQDKMPRTATSNSLDPRLRLARSRDAHRHQDLRASPRLIFNQTNYASASDGFTALQ